MATPLLLSEKVRQFTYYWRNVVCVYHVTIIYQAKKQSSDYVVSKKKNRERERGQHNTETIDVAAASAAYDLSARIPVRYSPSPHLGRLWVHSVLSKMTAKGLRLSNLCSFILELCRRPVVQRPLSSLAVVVRSLPYVASSAAYSPRVVGRRPSVQQPRCRHCRCILLLPPRSLVACRS